MIYLDYNGTTPVDPRVLDEMLPYLRDFYGNPSSQNVHGKRCKAALEKARAQVAELIGARPAEIVFTSGATESNNWILRSHPGHIVTSAVEHPSVLKTLEALDCSFEKLPVDACGRLILPHKPARAALVSVMHAQNETGVLQDLAAVKERFPDTPLHSDAAQSVGKIPVKVDELKVDFLTIAGHKLYAPKGVGAVFMRRPLPPLFYGAGQEHGLRSGTENVAYAVALGCACELASRSLSEEQTRVRALRDRLEQLLGDAVERNGHPEHRLPNTLHVNFLGVSGAELLRRCPDLSASTGAACKDGSGKLSHVLEAMGVDRERGLGAVRITLGRFTTAEEVEKAAEIFLQAYRSLAPVGSRGA